MAAEASHPTLCTVADSDLDSVIPESPDCAKTVENQEDYLYLLRRIPQPSTIDSVPYASPEDTLPARMIAAILQLPQEIIHHVFYWLDPRDLLPLRASCRVLHNLVHTSERDICLSLADRIQRDYNFRLPRFYMARDLSQFFQHHSSIEAICQVADVTASKITSSLRYKPLFANQAAIEVWRQGKYTRLQSRLRRAFYILHLYLEFISKTVINEDQHLRDFTDEEFTSLHNIYDLDQQDFFVETLDWLTEEDFVTVSCSLKIFKTMCKARKVPFGLSSRAYPFASVRQILFCRGLVPFARLLPDDVDTVKQEMILRELATDLTGLKRARMCNKEDAATPLKSIHHIRPSVSDRSSLPKLVRRSIGTRNEFFSNQDLWDKSGRAFMMRKLGRFPSLQSVTAWLTQILEDPQDKRGDVMIGTWDQGS